MNKKFSFRKMIERVVENFEGYNFSYSSDYNELIEEIGDILYHLEYNKGIKVPSRKYIGYLIEKNTCGVFHTKKHGYNFYKDGVTRLY